MIEIRNVVKRYQADRPPAVNNLTLEVKEGEIFGFLGPNGAGKSTTIKIMASILRQDSGTVSICGYDNLSASLALKRMIGYVPDEPLFYEQMSGFRHLAFIGDMYGIKADHLSNRITQWAQLFELEGALGDRIASYSRGMKQKLAIISALIGDNRVLLLDEPMTALDPKAAFNLKELMRSYCQKGGTIFFSTHVLEVAQQLCTTLGIIHHGSLIATGNLESFAHEGRSLEELFLELTHDA